MIYENVPVFQDGLDYSKLPFGVATINVDENGGKAEIIIRTITSEFNMFLKKGELKALSLNALVVAPIPREEPDET